MSELDELVAGTVLTPRDAQFEDACHVWNARFTGTPDAALRCASPAHVAEGLKFARGQGMAVTVKGGGHDYAGHSACRHGLLLDLSPLRGLTIDRVAKRARVGGGLTWGELDAKAQDFGLATPGPTVSTVGVGGSTLGGGEGWLTRKHGFSIDNLLSAEVVTASGDIVTASPHEHHDLFWALRGGGGNFGVVTSFEFQLHELAPELLAGQVIYPANEARRLVAAYRDFCADAPDEVACFLFFLRIPAIPDFPEALHGQLVVDFVVSYAGSPEEGEAVLAPVRRLGTPIADTVAPVPYVTLQQSFDAALPDGNRWYTRARYFDALPDAAVDAFLEHLDPFPGAFTTAYFGAGGGAAGRVDPGATAFPHRNAAFGLHILAGWTSPSEDDAVMAWSRRLHDALRPWGAGVYSNLLGEDEPARIPEAYGRNHARLAELKAEWDPDNVFRSNHNIVPVR